MTELERLAFNAGLDAARAELDQSRQSIGRLVIPEATAALMRGVLDVLDDDFACLIKPEPQNDPEARRRAFALVTA